MASTGTNFIQFGQRHRTSDEFQRQFFTDGYEFTPDRKITFQSETCPCLNFKAERDDEGNIRIGRFSFATNFRYALFVFGFFFTLVGIILTILSYRLTTQPNTTTSLNIANSTKTDQQTGQFISPSSNHNEGKITGPIFIAIGFILFVTGIGFTLLYTRLNQEYKTNRRFSSVGPENPCYSISSEVDATANGGGERKGSDSSAVFQINNSEGGGSHGSSKNSSRRPSSALNSPTKLTMATLTPNTLFPDSYTFGDTTEDHNTRKASLTLRPSPTFRNHSIVTTIPPSSSSETLPAGHYCSDTPYGSIVGLAGNGDIACFPPTPIQGHHKVNCSSNSGVGLNPAITNKTAGENKPIMELPQIQVHEWNSLSCTQALENATAQQQQVRKIQE